MLWESRELPSRVYGWVAFATANLLCEVPYAILWAVIYFFVWYYPIGFPTDSATAGYTFFIVLIWFVWPFAMLLTKAIHDELGTVDCCVCFDVYGCRQSLAFFSGYGSSDYWRFDSLLYYPSDLTDESTIDGCLEIHDVLHYLQQPISSAVSLVQS